MKISVHGKASLLWAATLLVGASVAALWYFGLGRDEATFEIRTHEAVTGLIAGAPVEFHGVEVGRVDQVTLIDPRSVRIVLTVSKPAPITQATVATITARGLAARGYTGYVYVSLEDDGVDARAPVTLPGARYPTIRSAPSVSDNLDTTMARLTDSVQAANALLRDALDTDTRATFKQMVREERQTMVTMRSDVLPQVRKAASDLDLLSVTLQGKADKFDPLLNASAESLEAFRTQVLPEAYRAAADLDHLSRTLNGFAARINQDPSVLVRGNAKPRPGPGESH